MSFAHMGAEASKGTSVSKTQVYESVILCHRKLWGADKKLTFREESRRLLFQIKSERFSSLNSERAKGIVFPRA